MFLIGDKRFRDYDLTNAGNRGLQVTPCRNYGSGLPKEAHRDISNFRANRKRAVLGNLHEIMPVFSTSYDKKMYIVVKFENKKGEVSKFEY